MRLHAAALLLGVGLGLCVSAQASDLYVIVNARSSVQSLSRRDVIGLFTGRVRMLPDGTMAAIYDQPADSPARAAFYQRLAGMDLARINSYWSRLLFTGQVQPPQPLAGDAAVIATVRGNRAAVGYVTVRPGDPAVRVAFTLPQDEVAP
jgi:hypothetical protein